MLNLTFKRHNISVQLRTGINPRRGKPEAKVLISFICEGEQIYNSQYKYTTKTYLS